jgi:hypothetical protein
LQPLPGNCFREKLPEALMMIPKVITFLRWPPWLALLEESNEFCFDVPEIMLQKFNPCNFFAHVN